MSASRILAEALALPLAERAELAAKLVESLDEGVPGVLGPSDLDEIRRRAADARSGAPGVSLEDLREAHFSK